MAIDMTDLFFNSLFLGFLIGLLFAVFIKFFEHNSVVRSLRRGLTYGVMTGLAFFMIIFGLTVFESVVG